MWSHIYKPRLLGAKLQSSYRPVKLFSFPEAFICMARTADSNQDAAFHCYSLQSKVLNDLYMTLVS